MAGRSFTAQLRQFEQMTEEHLLAVFRASAQEVFSIAQTTRFEGGRLPIDTGNLRNTFISFLNGSSALVGPDAYSLILASAELGDTVFGGWTAVYARRMEFGFVGTDKLGRVYNQRGFGFMRSAAQQWTDIVYKNAAALAA